MNPIMNLIKPLNLATLSANFSSKFLATFSSTLSYLQYHPTLFFLVLASIGIVIIYLLASVISTLHRWHEADKVINAAIGITTETENETGRIISAHYFYDVDAYKQFCAMLEDMDEYDEYVDHEPDKDSEECQNCEEKCSEYFEKYSEEMDENDQEINKNNLDNSENNPDNSDKIKK